MRDSACDAPLRLVRIGIRGGILEDVTLPAGSA